VGQAEDCGFPQEAAKNLTLSALKSGIYPQNGLKKGRNSPFLFTISLLGKNYILLIQLELQARKGSKKDFHREGGWGYAGF
jgi:hypothetical protein